MLLSFLNEQLHLIHFYRNMNDTIYARFKIQVADRGSDIAIIDDDLKISYRSLDSMSDDVAAALGDVKGKRVGILLSHGAWMIASMLGILKSGAAYVPAEPSLPAERIRYMMDTANVTTVIDEKFIDHLSKDTGCIPDRSTPDGEAYVLFTSGTTGRPKGVIITNRNVVNYADAFENEFHPGPGDTMLQLSVCSFDIFVEEVFTTLLSGATLAIPPAETVTGGIQEIMEYADRHNVTIISSFPYLFADMNRLKSVPQSLRLLISGGDVLRDSYIDRLKGNDFQIYNTYGPSETTVCATYCRCDNIPPLDDGTYPIGHPVKGVIVKILDSKGNEVPPGCRGEICIIGRGVGNGYTGTPPEQKNFTVNPTNGAKMYRSGDLGYILPDGNLAFLHRKDSQVMISGKRVEPEEVENVLNELEDIEAGVVKPFTDEHGLSYLVAYFVPKRKHISLTRIKSWLKSKLTDFMIPEFFVELSKLPLTRRGKVDKKSLPVILRN